MGGWNGRMEGSICEHYNGCVDVHVNLICLFHEFFRYTRPLCVVIKGTHLPAQGLHCLTTAGAPPSQPGDSRGYPSGMMATNCEH